MKPILEIQSVSKKFNIYHEGGPYLSLRDKVVDLIKFKSSKKSNEEFWALNNVNFDVLPGESIGIIGKNGAGKSTLLKVLSKITPPTQGRIVSRGRIASLLEVGTGFHPELTGSENVYLNGSILGMRKKEIDSHFDEIIDFAGTEKFLDTPLKHYSSGMQLRLAFAVAAFLEPEILIIDEVLAVGDAEFQKKCLGKMEDVSKNGRTILFVSHQLGMVSQLCKKIVFLENGSVVGYGNSDEIIRDYTRRISTENVYRVNENDSDKPYSVISVKPLNSELVNTSSYAHDEEIILEIVFAVRKKTRGTNLIVSVNNKNGHRVFSIDRNIDDVSSNSDNTTTAYLTIPKVSLTPGSYSFFIALHKPNNMAYDLLDKVCPISVFDNGSEFIKYENRWFYGDVFVPGKFEFK